MVFLYMAPKKDKRKGAAGRQRQAGILAGGHGAL